MLLRVHRSAALVALLTLLTSSGALASTSTFPRPATLLEAQDAVARMQAAIATDSLSSIMQTAAELEGVEGVRPAAVSLDTVAEGFSGMIGELFAAIRTAGALAHGSIRGTAEEIERLTTAARELETPKDAGQLESARALEADLSALVAKDELYSGALTLTEAVDAALPSLRQMAAAMPATGSEEPCDMHHLAPYVCISGTGAQTYTKNYALIIDFGGNDLYRNAAGGANGTIGGEEWDRVDAALLMDLAGDDVYEEPKDATGRPRAVQGAGSRGAIGILLDDGGDDRYVAGDMGQGYGELGVGILDDRAGNDTYQIVNNGPGWIEGVNANNIAVHGVNGQGSTTLGAGFLLDRGTGDDSYRLETFPTPVEIDGRILPGGSYVTGMGAAFAGPGIFRDDGGADSMTILGGSSPGELDERRAVSVDAGFANVYGMGQAWYGGLGMHLSGVGPSQRSLRSEVEFGYLSWANGMGEAVFGSLGVLDDEGGNDLYNVAATRRTVQRLTIDERNAKSDHVSVYSSAGGVVQTWVSAMGHGSGFGAALLHDHAGKDRYLAEVVTYAEARAGNALEVLPESAEVPSADAHASAGESHLRGMGGGFFEGAGYLVDDDGDDVYETRSISEARAVATATHPDAKVVAIATALQAETIAMGVSVTSADSGEFRDLGGSDRYLTVNESIASASPPTFEQTTESRSFVWAFSNDTGDARFVDRGGIDTFEAVPETPPACVASRGARYWLDCGIGVAFGTNT